MHDILRAAADRQAHTHTHAYHGHRACRCADRGRRSIRDRRGLSPAPQRPGHRFAILEARGSLGGTWDLFRYPGIRSDSDRHTLGYSFAPWPDAQSIADGPSILADVKRSAAEYGVDREIRLHHRVVRADRLGEIEDGVMEFSAGGVRGAVAVPTAA